MLIADDNINFPPLSPFPPKHRACAVGVVVRWKSAQTSGRQKIIFRRLSGTKGPDVTRHILYDNISAPAPGPIHLWSWLIISIMRNEDACSEERIMSPHRGGSLSLFLKEQIIIFCFFLTIIVLYSLKPSFLRSVWNIFPHYRY